MWKRIKNLLELSKYSVEDLKEKNVYVSSSSGTIKYTYTPATIIETKEPFNQFEDETPEQSPDDTTPRN